MSEPRAVPMTDDELVAALAPLSLRSRLDPPSVAQAEGLGLTEPDDVAALVDHVERGLFDSPVSPPTDLGPDRRKEVAGSVAFQAVAAQILNPVLLAHRVLGIGLFPLIEDVRWRPDGWVVRYGLAPLTRGVSTSPTGAVIDRFRQQITGSLADRINAVLPVPLPGRLLLGNEQAAIRTALVAVGEAPAVLVRDSCCLIHLAGLVPCDECPLSERSA